MASSCPSCPLTSSRGYYEIGQDKHTPHPLVLMHGLSPGKELELEGGVREKDPGPVLDPRYPSEPAVEMGSGQQSNGSAGKL